MAQAGSVQREPSMEEILASIRRIIEDSDGTQGQAANDALLEPEESIDDDFNETGDVEHFRAELSAVARQEDAASELTDSSAEPEAIATDHEMFTSSEQPVAAEAAGSSVLDWPVNDWGSEDLGKEPETPETLAGESMAGPEASEQGVGDAPERRPAIISELAERKIAAAFEELNDAFETSRRRSLDEMAEEMLRPMLQDWLDNNLPLLVEKLVREEIERVARGGAR